MTAPLVDPEWLAEAWVGLCEVLAAALPDDLHYADDYAASPAPAGKATVVRGPLVASLERCVGVTYYDIEQTEPMLGLIEAFYQVRVRLGVSGLEALRLTGKIRAALHEQSGIALGRARASLILAGNLADVGPDENGRPQYTVNFRVRSDGALSTA